MIKGRAGNVVLIGLSRMNVERLMGDMPIRFDGSEIGLDGLVFVVIGGETEQAMHEQLKPFIGAETKVNDRFEAGGRRTGKA